MDGVIVAPASANRAVRLVYTDAYPVVCNLDQTTYPGAGEVVQDARYGMSNVVLPDRAYVWKVPAGEITDASLCLDVDLGPAGATVNTLGVVGYRAPTGLAAPGVEMYYKTVADTWAGAWRPWGPIAEGNTLRSHDYNVPCVRFVRAQFSGTSAVTELQLASVYAGEALLDFAQGYVVGTAQGYTLQRSRVRTVGGELFVTEYGPERQTALLRFPTMTLAQVNAMYLITKALEPFYLTFPNGVSYDCRATDSITAVAAYVGRWMVEFEVESVT